VINGETHAVQKYLLVGQRVWHTAFTPDENVANLKVIKSIQVGELPWGVAISRQ
jgi:hypothetical protein